MEQLKKELQEWGKKVCCECRELIKRGKTDKDFYVFQTAIPESSPELLLVGINPGGGKTYEEQVAKFRKGQHRKAIEDLTQGYNIYRDNTNNAFQSRALSRIASLSRFIESDKVTGINVCYFNTENITGLNADVFEFCAERTKELIKILQPKHILFLTIEEKTLRLVGVERIKAVDAYIKEGIWYGRKVYALPNHGYYRAYSYVNADKISRILDSYLR